MFKWFFLIIIYQPLFAFSNELDSYDFMNGSWRCVATGELTEDLIYKYENTSKTSVKNLSSKSISTFTTYNRNNRSLSSVLYIESTERMKFDGDIMSSFGVEIQKTEIIEDDLSFLTPEFIEAIKSSTEEISKSKINKIDNDHHTLTGIEDGDIMSCSRLKNT